MPLDDGWQPAPTGPLSGEPTSAAIVLRPCPNVVACPQKQIFPFECWVLKYEMLNVPLNERQIRHTCSVDYIQAFARYQTFDHALTSQRQCKYYRITALRDNGAASRPHGH
eukprot:6196461-Pleurochrysis_carterae.AAC.2